MASAPVLTEDGLQILKRRFAETWLREPAKTPFQLAQTIVGCDNPGAALRIANEWIVDEYVLTSKDELLAEHGEDFFLPTRSQFAREVLEQARSAGHIGDYRSAAALYKIHADVRDFMPKAGPVSVVDNSHKVIEVHNHGTPDEWSSLARGQQLELTAAV